MMIEVELNPIDVFLKCSNYDQYLQVVHFFELDDLTPLSMEQKEAIQWAFNHLDLLCRLRKEAI